MPQYPGFGERQSVLSDLLSIFYDREETGLEGADSPVNVRVPRWRCLEHMVDCAAEV